MKNNKGFISMAIVYSFFIIFVAVAGLIIANYTHNRILIHEMNKDIKDELSAAGNARLARFTNILKNGNMEQNTAWSLSDSSISYTNQQYASYSRSLQLAVPSVSKTVTITQNISANIVPGHAYYLGMKAYSPLSATGTNSSIALKQTSSGSTYPFPNLTTFVSLQSWQTIGSIVTIPSSIANNNNWQLVITETNKTGSPLYIDDLVLIDLTAATGSTIPPLEWLKANISYFEGTALYNRTYDGNHLTSY